MLNPMKCIGVASFAVFFSALMSLVAAPQSNIFAAINLANVWTALQTFNAGVTTSSIGVNNLGTYDNLGFYLYDQSILNGCSVATENAGVNETEALTGCVIVPATSTQTQVNGVGGYVENRSPNTNAVAVYGFGRTPVNGIGGATSGLWGANFNIQNCIGCTGSKMTVLELDINQQGPDATFGQALVQDGINIISAGTSKPRTGIGITATTSATYWQLGELIANYVTTGVQISNGAVSSTALAIVPPDDTSFFEVFGANHAGSTKVWTIGNSGAANFASVSTTAILVSALPAASTNTGVWRAVSNSTTVTAEGQTCVDAGGGGGPAAAFSNGTIWKCF